jgi:hypothetical protein
MPRSQDVQINIRLTTSQKLRLERAAAKLVAHTPGAKLPISQWLLRLGLDEADRILGK